MKLPEGAKLVKRFHCPYCDMALTIWPVFQGRKRVYRCEINLTTKAEGCKRIMPRNLNKIWDEYDKIHGPLAPPGLGSPKLAKLTPAEEHAWDFAMEFYLNEGWLDDEAAEHAWADLQAEFPRLKAFDGAQK